MNERYTRDQNYFLFIIFVLFMIFLICYFGWRIDYEYNKDSYQNPEQVLEKIKFDNFRQKEIKTIVQHIEKYNPDMICVADTLQYLLHKYNLPLELTLSQINIETIWSWNSRIISPVGARGLMQVMPLTGEFLAYELGYNYHPDSLFVPEYNLNLGCHYMASLFSDYKDYKTALAHYNGGPRNARRFAVNSPKLARETKNYIHKIFKE